MSELIFTSRSSMKTRFMFLIGIILLLLIFGTLFYHNVEGWSYIDSFYISAISLSTRGYGELHPTSAVSKIFTVLYLFIGVAFILYTLSTFIGYYIQYKEPVIQRKMSSIIKTLVPHRKDKWIIIKPHKIYDS